AAGRRAWHRPDAARNPAALSRRSGRNDAFAWPSLVRVGCEAQRLRLRGNAVEGLTGGGDLHARLAETSRSDNMWRFSTADGATSRLGPLVNGEVLRHVGDDGEIAHRPDGLLPAPTGPDAAPANPPVVRPRFSQSSLNGFFLVEVLLHAMSEINSAEPSSPFGKESAGKTEIRRIERIIVTSPLAMAPEDRQLLVERVHNAIDLVWRTQRFDEASSIAHPEKPQVALSIGGDVGFQLIHLYDEVKRKFGGSFEAFAACVGRPGDNACERLRMASIEVGMRALGLTVMDYELGADGTIEVQLVSTDRAAHGVERIADALAEVVIAPAIERALAAAGMADPRQFLIRFGEGTLGAPDLGARQDVKHLARRLETKVLRPAALQLVRHYAGLPPRAGLGVSRTRLDALAMAGGGRLDPTAAEFDTLAASAGARGFSLAAVLVDSSRRQFERQLSIELWPGIDAACDAVAAMQCDLVVIGGDMSGLADILDRMTVNAPVAPGRVAVLTGRGTDGPAHAGVDAVLAAYLASRGLLHSGQFRLATRKVADQLVLDAAPGKTALQRDPHSPLTIEVSPGQRYERMS
ncbi:MAG: virulence factor SrfB, partial [Hyphomicrobiaceae bacterium]|nr:virulence factor SrfB [Hyphomicrobiaceae bacterium]